MGAEIRFTSDISVADYNHLRKTVGWSVIEEKQALTGIHNSVFLVAAVHGNKTVGMARVVSDGGYVVIIVDVIVLPDYQGQGIGKSMMQKVMEYISNSLQEGQSVFVNLMAAKGRESFYSQFGFETRPNEKNGAGMTQWISRDQFQ